MLRDRIEPTVVAFACVLSACEETPRTAPTPSASASASSAPPAAAPREGCVRSGPLEGIENDPACVLARVSEDAMRPAMKRLSMTCAIDPPEVVAGAAGLLTVTITNNASTETLVVLEANTRAAG